MITYDMLTDENHELRGLFADNIAEYFNSNTDATHDITGTEVQSAILKATKNSVVKNEHGQLIPVYHGTDAEFDSFTPGDVGIHFGSYAQAVVRATDKKFKNPGKSTQNLQKNKNSTCRNGVNQNLPKSRRRG